MTKNKLIDLYQKTAEDSGEEVERLRSAVHEMKAALMPISEGALLFKLFVMLKCKCLKMLYTFDVFDYLIILYLVVSYIYCNV